jgi:predicted DCC family thiol-disulfide oxidoreductase YuxK
MKSWKVRYRLETEPIVIFDGVCNLYSHSAQFIIRHDRHATFKLATTQSTVGRDLLTRCGMNPDQLETFVLLKDGQVYVRSDAALQIAQELDWPWRVLGAFRFIPRALRDSLYNLVARNRYRWFGKKDRCMVPTDEIRSRFIE